VKTFDIREAKAQLPTLVERACAGEEIILTKAGEPVARIVAYHAARLPRKPGALKGKFRVGKEFFAPLPEDILAAFGANAPKKPK
jgi:prevent-host-death family protein